MSFTPIAEADALVTGIIDKHKDLDVMVALRNSEASIRCVVGKMPKHVIAKICTVNQLWQVLGVNQDYIIKINELYWDRFSSHQKEGVLFHELMHCEVAVSEEGEIKFKIRRHDVEEFTLVLDRYGVYVDGGLDQFLRVGSAKVPDKKPV